MELQEKLMLPCPVEMGLYSYYYYFFNPEWSQKFFMR